MVRLTGSVDYCKIFQLDRFLGDEASQSPTKQNTSKQSVGFPLTLRDFAWHPRLVRQPHGIWCEPGPKGKPFLHFCNRQPPPCKFFCRNATFHRRHLGKATPLDWGQDLSYWYHRRPDFRHPPCPEATLLTRPSFLRSGHPGSRLPQEPPRLYSYRAAFHKPLYAILGSDRIRIPIWFSAVAD
mgnify:FL=1